MATDLTKPDQPTLVCHQFGTATPCFDCTGHPNCPAPAKPDQVEALRVSLQATAEAAASHLNTVIELREQVAKLQSVGDALASQTRSYSRGRSGSVSLGKRLNAWDVASAALGAKP